MTRRTSGSDESRFDLGLRAPGNNPALLVRALPETADASRHRAPIHQNFH
ncbi:hypothetical protein HT585_05365 [Ensifer sp. HO-A22]|uniref:Uncharacterized protein n=1 Tax=Ensifer oleiphilus TaxID=2742698 RepID=A0A7Y6Q3B2_9HYPH|nr:hypothetical protein [Ensifer oleiphilus]NVD38274.1 hypothetical protein [Ensifer oleiphilus]